MQGLWNKLKKRGGVFSFLGIRFESLQNKLLFFFVKKNSDRLDDFTTLNLEPFDC